MMHKLLPMIMGLLSLPALAAPTVNILTDRAAYDVGDTLELSVVLTEFPKTHGGGINLAFNPDVVQVQGVAIDSTWSFVNKKGAVNNTEGRVDDILFSSLIGEEGEQLPVATVTMRVIAPGDAGIRATESAMNPFTDTGGQIGVNFNNAVSGLVVAGGVTEAAGATAGVDSTAGAQPFAIEAVLRPTAGDHSTDGASALAQTPAASSSAGTAVYVAAAARAGSLSARDASVPDPGHDDSADGGYSTGARYHVESAHPAAGRGIDADRGNQAAGGDRVVSGRTGTLAQNAASSAGADNPVIMAANVEELAADFVEHASMLPSAGTSRQDSTRSTIRNTVLFIAAVCLLIAGYFVKTRLLSSRV